MKLFNFKKYNENNDLIYTKEFKSFFGDWENDKENSSVIVDDNDKPKIVYHQTKKEYVEDILTHGFKFSNEKHSKFDFETPYGHFFKSSDKDIGLEGKSQIKGYLNVRNPIVFLDRNDIKNRISNISKKYATLYNDIEKIDFKYNSIIDNYLKEFKKERRNLNNKSIEKYKKEKKEIFKKWESEYNKIALKLKQELDRVIKRLGYDGFIIKNDEGSFGRYTDTIIIFNPNQFLKA